MTHQFQFPRVQSAGLRGAAEVGREQGVSRTEYATLRQTKPIADRLDELAGDKPDERFVEKVKTFVNGSPIIDAFDKRALLERTDPLLALAFYVEAVADGRTQGGVDAYSKIAALQQEARRMLRQVGAPLERVAELYPRYGEMKGHDAMERDR